MYQLNYDAFFNKLFEFLANPSLFFFDNILHAIALFTLPLSAVLAAIITYALMRTSQIRKKEYAHFKKLAEKEAVATAPKNPQWEKVMEHLSSDNPGDWRLAILEADIMLGQVLDIMGLSGTNIGDKLKGVEKSDFITVDRAWEAHRIRNQIAHEGAAFILNQREARRIIDLYRQVFDEFRYV